MAILLVDITTDQKQWLEQVLDDPGHGHMIGVDSWQQAFSILGVHNPKRTKKIDLIITNLVASDTATITACETLRSMPHLRDIPILAIMDANAGDTLEMLLNLGLTDVLTKPVSAMAVQTRVAILLRLKKEMDHRKAVELELTKTSRQLDDARMELQRLANLDGLTLLANRHMFDQYLSREWNRLTRVQLPLSVMLAGIDQFSAYNATHGYRAGDECLRTIARILTKRLRRTTDLAARYDQDQFAAILPNTDPQGAFVLAEAIRNRIFQLKLVYTQDNTQKPLTLSVGCASAVPTTAMIPDQLVQSAQQALSRAKIDGGNCVVVF